MLRKYFIEASISSQKLCGNILVERPTAMPSAPCANNKGNFTKKATGRITFTCNDGHLIEQAIQETIKTGEGQTFWMKSIGTDEKGIQVSEMDFEWSVRAK